mmetsp:Transcript_9360/g.28927  ORF Transcript_9360/g.28927 Transcript_9360/m.28927 type:complete len:193 (+) Transcript_9360:184-762(+)
MITIVVFITSPIVGAISSAPLRVADDLDNIEWAAAYDEGSKTVFCSFWPGPIVGFYKGWPKWPNNLQPPVADKRRWQYALAGHIVFPLAAFLTVVQPNVFMTYAAWYELHQGVVPCPNTHPPQCAAPDNWYPELAQPLGRPLTNRTKVGPWAWARQFEHATVYVDLQDVVASRIDWHNVPSIQDEALTQHVV